MQKYVNSANVISVRIDQKHEPAAAAAAEMKCGDDQLRVIMIIISLEFLPTLRPLAKDRLDCDDVRRISTQFFIRPPGTVVPDGLLFYRRCFF